MLRYLSNIDVFRVDRAYFPGGTCRIGMLVNWTAFIEPDTALTHANLEHLDDYKHYYYEPDHSFHQHRQRHVHPDRVTGWLELKEGGKRNT